MAARARLEWTSIAVFLAIAFGIAWAIWIAMYAFDLPWWVSVAASWGPGIAALLVRGPLRREGFKDSGILHLGKGPGAIGAYGVAVLLIPFVAIGSTLMGVGAGAFEVRWDADGGLTSPNQIVFLVTDHFGLIGLILSFVAIPLVPVIELGEEIGWRDWLVPRLLPLGQVVALLGSSAIWAVWHLPFSLVLGYNKGAAGFPLFALDLVLFGALLAYLRLKSRSIWPCAILHAAYNYQPWVALALTMVRPGYSPFAPEQSIAILEYGVTMVAGLVALVLAWRRPRPPT